LPTETGLPFDPQRFLDVAKSLAKHEDEGSLRSAVGRAYYATFITERDRLRITELENVHGKVVDEVNRTVGNSIGTQLAAMRRLRAIADYEMVPVDPTCRDWRENCDKQLTLASLWLPRMQSLTRQRR
jgi:hypothetical protein